MSAAVLMDINSADPEVAERLDRRIRGLVLWSRPNGPTTVPGLNGGPKGFE